MPSPKLARWSPWLLVVLLLSLWIRGTHVIDWQETIEGDVQDVISIFREIDRYPDLDLTPSPYLERAEFIDRWTDLSPDGARLEVDHFVLETRFNTGYGNRHYRHSADGKTVTVHIYYDSPTFFEFSNELWIFEQDGDQTRVTGSGTRRAPWLFGWYSDVHSAAGQEMIHSIERALAGPSTAGDATRAAGENG